MICQILSAKISIFPVNNSFHIKRLGLIANYCISMYYKYLKKISASIEKIVVIAK